MAAQDIDATVTAIEAWPQPSSIPTRTLKRRTLARFRASAGGWFWLQCPVPACRQWFGGHEVRGSLAVHDDPERPWLGRVVCPAHDEVWPDGVMVPSP